MSNRTVGVVIGRGIGRLGAYALEGAVRSAQGAGRFGADIVTGAETGYAEQREVLLTSRAKLALDREAKKAAYLAALTAPAVETVAPVATTQKAAKLAVKAA